MVDSTNTIAVGAAMDWELESVLAALARRGEVHRQGRTIWRATSGPTTVLAYRTGVGIKTARRNTRELLRQSTPSLIINAGCAGALEEGWLAGDTAVADVILGPPPGCEQWTVAPSIREMICEIAKSTAGRDVRIVTTLTCRSPLLTGNEKRAHGHHYAAQIVEMEGAGVAEAATDSGCPFASIRVILDPMMSDLPEVGSPEFRKRSRSRQIARLLSSPTQAYRAAQLYRNTKLAQASLSRFCDNLFESLHAGMIDPHLLGLR